MTKRSLEQIQEALRAQLTELYNVPLHDISLSSDLDVVKRMQDYRDGKEPGGWNYDPGSRSSFISGGGGRGSSISGSGRSSAPGAPKVWRRGGEPVAPPANKPAPPNVWRKGEALPKPAEPSIGSQVGKVPKKKLDEPVDLSKEFEKIKPAAKKEKSAAPEFSADKKDRMGRKEPTMTQNNEPELRADRRPDRIVEPSSDVKAPGAKGWVGGAAGAVGALSGAGYLYGKYQDEQSKAEQDAAYREVYGKEPPTPAPLKKSGVLKPADPDNPDYAPLKEAKPQPIYSKKQYIAWAKKYSKLYDVPLSVVLHAMQKETGSYDANTAAGIRGPKTRYGQAVGVMQLMPKFFPKLKPEDFVDPEKNIEAGTKELARLYNTYKDPKAALAAYNMGENRDSFREWLKTRDSKLLPKQTREYINGNPKKGTLGYIDDPKVQIAQLDPETTKDKVARVATDVVSTLAGAGSAEAKPSRDEKKVKVAVHPQLKPDASEFDPSRLQDLDPEFAGRLKSALDAYGKPLRVTSATRTPIEQTQAFKNWATGKSPFPASKELSAHKGFAIDVDKNDLAKFHQWLQAEKKAGRDYGLETGYEWKKKDPVHLQARDWRTIEKQREFDKYQDQDTKVAQVKPEVKRDEPVSKVEVPTAHPSGTYVQPDWSKYSYGDLGPLKKDSTGQWKTEDGKQTATDPKLIADLEKLPAAKSPSFIDRAISAITGGKDAKAEPATTVKKDTATSKDAEREKELGKLVRGVVGDLSGAPAASARDDYYRQQLEKAKQEQEKAKQEKAVAAEPEKKAVVSKVKKAAPRKAAVIEPEEKAEVPAVKVAAAAEPDKIDVKDLTKDQDGLASAIDTKVDQNAELVAQKQAEENQRKQEAERKAAEARAQAEADRLAAQERARQELDANRQAAMDRAKKAEPVQQTVSPSAGPGLKNMWDQGITALTGKQRVNLKDPRITLPESINTELQEILRLAGKKTKE